MKIAVKLALLSLAAFIPACGDDSSNSGGSCPVPEACGGDIVGKWRYVDSCVPGSNTTALSSCSGASYTARSVNVRGTIEYRADGTTIEALNGTISGRYSFPTSCLKQSCNETAAALTSGSSTDTAVCSESGTTCACDATFQAPNDSSTSTYTTMGSAVTETDASGGSTTSSYCVRGDAMSMTTDAGYIVHLVRE